MEDMIMATQDQALRTNAIKTTDKQNVPAKCRMAEKLMRQLTIMVLKCKKLAQKQYWCCREDKIGADDSVGPILYVECWVMTGMTNTCITQATTSVHVWIH